MKLFTNYVSADYVGKFWSQISAMAENFQRIHLYINVKQDTDSVCLVYVPERTIMYRTLQFAVDF